MIHVLRVRDALGRAEYWTGHRWSHSRGDAVEFTSLHDAGEARRWIESDRDVLIVREVARAAPEGRSEP